MIEKKDYTFPYAHLENSSKYLSNEGYGCLVLQIDTRKYHIYLNHHKFGGNCFVPGTMIMEIMIETALWFSENMLNKKLIPIKLTNIKFDRPLSIPPEEQLVVHIHFIDIIPIMNGININIKITSPRLSATGEVIGNRINASSSVSLRKQRETPNNIGVLDISYNQFTFNKDDYYRIFFPSLSYLFQTCTGKISTNSEQSMLIGEYDCDNKEQEYITNNNIPFYTSPLGNDSCLQYAVFLSRIISGVGRLPIGGDKLVIRERHPKSGPVKVFVKCNSIDDTIMKFDFYSFTGSLKNPSIFVIGENFVARKSPFHETFSREFLHTILKSNIHR